MAALLDLGLDLVFVLRLAYITAAALVLLISYIPALSSRFLAYGPRASTAPPSATSKEQGELKEARKTAQPQLVFQVLDGLASVCVPHAWFISFYAVSTTCSLFWASQLVTRGPAFALLADGVREEDASMTIRQVMLAWAMLTVQGSRRLYECLAFSQPSKSQMWVGHWVLGIGFYVGTSVAIWIEGIPTIQSHIFTLNDIAIAGPTVRTFLGILLFILASGFQHDCHAYLASLKTRKPSPTSAPASPNPSSATASTYKLPEHPAFAYLIAPHYTAECLIYLALALVATPSGAWINWTLVCALVFVAANLGVTAAGTKNWYERTFGPEAVEGKWKLIPLIW